MQKGELYYHSNHAPEVRDNKIVDVETHLVKMSVRNPVYIQLESRVAQQPQCIFPFSLFLKILRSQPGQEAGCRI